MRSGTNSNINSGQVHSWALGLLIDAKLFKDHGWKCTTTIVLSITLRAAARCISISAACRDLAKAAPERWPSLPGGRVPRLMGSTYSGCSSYIFPDSSRYLAFVPDTLARTAVVSRS